MTTTYSAVDAWDMFDRERTGSIIDHMRQFATRTEEQKREREHKISALEAMHAGYGIEGYSASGWNVSVRAHEIELYGPDYYDEDDSADEIEYPEWMEDAEHHIERERAISSERETGPE